MNICLVPLRIFFFARPSIFFFGVLGHLDTFGPSVPKQGFLWFLFCLYKAWSVTHPQKLKSIPLRFQHLNFQSQIFMGDMTDS